MINQNLKINVPLQDLDLAYFEPPIHWILIPVLLDCPQAKLPSQSFHVDPSSILLFLPVHEGQLSSLRHIPTMNLSIVKLRSILVRTPVEYPSFWQNLSAPFLLSEKLWAQIGDHKRFQNIIGEPSLSNFTSPFWHVEGVLISGNSELRSQNIRGYKLLKFLGNILNY